MTAFEPMPPAPAGFVACRVMGPSSLTTHLVALDEHGSNGGRPTVCGLIRFGEDADLPGWGMGDSGTTGPGVEQIKCEACYAARGLTCYLEGDVLVCGDCGTRTGYQSTSAAQVAWSLHVLQEHWEQAGLSEPDRDALLAQMAEALR